MKFAPVCPVSIYQHLQSLGKEYIGDYFLLLAHDVLAYPEEYGPFFRELIKQNPDTVIIMDNSVIELKESCTAKTLHEACQIVPADVVAIPDVLEDGQGTYEAAKQFLKEWSQISGSGFTPAELMYIPQGKDIDDYRQCWEGGYASFGDAFQWVGIARNLTGRIFPTRIMAAGYIHTYAPEKSLHLLGFSDDTYDDIKTCQATAKFVEGIDSAVPLRLGTQGVDASRPGYGLPDPGPRGNWWEEVREWGGGPLQQTFVGTNTLATRRKIGEM